MLTAPSKRVIVSTEVVECQDKNLTSVLRAPPRVEPFFIFNPTTQAEKVGRLTYTTSGVDFNRKLLPCTRCRLNWFELRHRVEEVMKHFLFWKIRQGYAAWQKVGNPVADAVLFSLSILLAGILAWRISVGLESGNDVGWQLLGFSLCILFAAIVPVGTLSDIRKHREQGPELGGEET